MLGLWICFNLACRPHERTQRARLGKFHVQFSLTWIIVSSTFGEFTTKRGELFVVSFLQTETDTPVYKKQAWTVKQCICLLTRNEGGYSLHPLLCSGNIVTPSSKQNCGSRLWFIKSLPQVKVWDGWNRTFWS